MPKTPDQKAAIKKREKLATPADPMAAEPLERVPREGTSEWYFYQYGQAYARGMAKATGRPFTPPIVAGPQCLMIKLLQTHCRGEDGKILRGKDTLEWIENVVCDFRLNANEREYGYGNHAWSPSAFARWLDNGLPKANATPQSQAAERRAHIAIRKG